MKITKEQLQKLIKESVQSLMESKSSEKAWKAFEKFDNNLRDKNIIITYGKVFDMIHGSGGVPFIDPSNPDHVKKALKMVLSNVDKEIAKFQKIREKINKLLISVGTDEEDDLRKRQADVFTRQMNR